MYRLAVLGHLPDVVSAHWIEGRNSKFESASTKDGSREWKEMADIFLRLFALLMPQSPLQKRPRLENSSLQGTKFGVDLKDRQEASVTGQGVNYRV
jgi:hypothetical protein